MKLVFSLLLVALGLGCSSNQRLMTPPRITATGPVYRVPAVAPDTGEVVAFLFTLADAEDVPINVAIEVSRAGGAFVAVGSPQGGAIATGGDGVVGLTAPIQGAKHRFYWRPQADLGATEEVRFRLTPSEPAIAAPPLALAAVPGLAVTSSPFTVGALQAEAR